MAQPNILDYVKYTYENHNNILKSGNINAIQKYKQSLSCAIPTLEYEIDYEKYMIKNNMLDLTQTRTTAQTHINYNNLIKVSLFNYLLRDLEKY